MPQHIEMDIGPEDVQIGFPVVKAGRIPCRIGTPTVENSKKGTPMYVFPLILQQDVPCEVTDRETGTKKEILYGNGKALLKYYASLNPEALRFGSLTKIELACRLKGSLWLGKGQFAPENLPQFAGKTVLASVVNSTREGTGELQANVNDLFPL